MAAIRSKNTKPELIVRRYLHALGLRYGLHNKRLPGHPDIVLRRLKVVIFVHGCFWHGHQGCPKFTMPKSRQDYWVPKIEANRNRDARDISRLKAMGWKVIVVWECELRPRQRCLETLYSLGSYLLSLRDKPLNQYVLDDEPEEIAAEEAAQYGIASDEA